MFNRTRIKIIRNNKVLFIGNIETGREFIEDLLMDKIGYSPMLQEDPEDGNIYLHSEFYEGLTEKEIKEIESYGFSEDVDDSTVKAIEKILDVNIEFYPPPIF